MSLRKSMGTDDTRRIAIRQAAKEANGFTRDPSGANLPADRGAFSAFKAIEIFEDHPSRGLASSNWLRNAAASETTKGRWNAAELQRISGELALKSPERDAGEQKSISSARLPSLVSSKQNPGNSAPR